MKKIFLLLMVIFLCAGITHAQRILINENFESTAGIGTDSLPSQWAKFKVNGVGVCTWAVWGARDSGQVMCNSNSICSFLTKAHQSKRALNIPWTCTSATISDDWVFTKAVTIAANDSLIFWMQLGTYPCAAGTYYNDSCQVWVSTVQNPTGGIKTKLGTVVALPSASNVWQNIKYNLSAFAGQTVYIGFRYNMDLSVDGVMVNIDDIFVGNHSGVSNIAPVNSAIPKSYALLQNYPNPFNPITKINFDIPKSGFVTLKVLNALGKEMVTLVNGVVNPGTYSVDFDGTKLSSGAYFYRLESNGFVSTRKMMLIK
jgi:hypothetical protein